MKIMSRGGRSIDNIGNSVWIRRHTLKKDSGAPPMFDLACTTGDSLMPQLLAHHKCLPDQRGQIKRFQQGCDFADFYGKSDFFFAGCKFFFPTVRLLSDFQLSIFFFWQTMSTVTE